LNNESNPSPGGLERRRQERFNYRPRPVVRLLVKPSFHNQWADLENVCAQGLRLGVTVPLRVETRLVLELPNWYPGPMGNLQAYVVYAIARPDEMGWSIGCRLAQPLSEDELVALATCGLTDSLRSESDELRPCASELVG
jgi:hypothetical protein